jgi:hypothetical protein
MSIIRREWKVYKKALYLLELPFVEQPADKKELMERVLQEDPSAGELRHLGKWLDEGISTATYRWLQKELMDPYTWTPSRAYTIRFLCIMLKNQFRIVQNEYASDDDVVQTFVTVHVGKFVSKYKYSSFLDRWYRDEDMRRDVQIVVNNYLHDEFVSSDITIELSVGMEKLLKGVVEEMVPAVIGRDWWKKVVLETVHSFLPDADARSRPLMYRPSVPRRLDMSDFDNDLSIEKLKRVTERDRTYQHCHIRNGWTEHIHKKLWKAGHRVDVFDDGEDKRRRISSYYVQV